MSDQRLFALSILTTLWLPVAGPTLADETGSIEGRLAHRHVNYLYPAVVYIEELPDRSFPAPPEPVVIDQVDQRFTPRVTAIQIGGTIVFQNSDGVTHNVRSASGSAQEFDVGDFDPGEEESLTIEAPGVIEVGRHLHSAMIAYIVVVETPWFARTDRRGRFTIPDLPPGVYRLTFWHEKLDSQTVSVRVAAGEVSQVEFLDLVRSQQE